jgi:hypothetical protein
MIVVLIWERRPTTGSIFSITRSQKKLSKKLDSGETGMNLYVLTRTMKIVEYMKGPASGPLFRHGGTGGLIVFLVTDPPRGRPSGDGGVHRK